MTNAHFMSADGERNCEVNFVKCHSFPLTELHFCCRGEELRKQEVGRTMVFLQTGYEDFLTGHTTQKENVSRRESIQGNDSLF